MKVQQFSCVLALVAGLFISQAAKAQLLLDDFSSSIRKNGDGDDLWFAYLGEDPIQTYGLENGMLKVTTGPAPNGVYMDFLPRAGGYPFPQGYAQTFLKSGTWDPNVNRLRFMVKCSMTVPRDPGGSDNLQIGTYIRGHNNSDPSWKGTHYYHLLDGNFYAGQWSNVEINRVPQHQVGQSGYTIWPEDPEWGNQGVHYFDGLTVFYFDTQGPAWSNQTCYFDNFEFDTESGEPDSYVSSISSTYNGTAYEVAFAAPKNSVTTYEVRYSTSSMKSTGFNSGSPGGTVSSPGSAYTGTLWKSPAMPQVGVMYVAIRPTSGSAFSEIKILSAPGVSQPSASSPCDLNRDGAVNSADVSQSTQELLGSRSCSGDLDGNGRCDVVDLQRIVNASNGGNCRTGQ
jgi:hypothetical protein